MSERRPGFIAGAALLALACTELRPGDEIQPGPMDRDAGGALDAEPSEDAAVTECVPEFGHPCTRSGFCGATYDCTGACAGGFEAPPCSCAVLVCDSSSNLWSVCPDPPTFGDLCDHTGGCGGQIGCDGMCAGGGPLPECDCGTPTCEGCIGGTCDVYSTCTEGHCECIRSSCTATAAQACSMGSLYNCNVDRSGCAGGSTPETCQFGCDNGAQSCNCDPETGEACFMDCMCPCGAMGTMVGETQCDGGCDSFDACDCLDACCPTC